MTDKWADYKKKFCGCKDASRSNACKGLPNCELPDGHAERKCAAPRQPEGEGLEVVGLQWLDSGHYRKKPPKYGFNPHDWNELCRLSDAKRAIAERDATIERLEAGIPRLQEHAHQMRQQRDKLAGLLNECRGMVAREVERWTRASEILPVTARVESSLLQRIDAALAEVNKP